MMCIMREFELIAPEKFVKNEVEVPEVKTDEIKIEVKALGICGSDIHAYYGEHPFMGFPIVLGHECSGVVVEMGRAVTNLAIGDRVVLRPQEVCGECRPCKEGRYNICEKLQVLGCQIAGGCSDYYVAKAELFYKLPNNLGFEEGTMIEPLAVAVHAALRAGSVEGKNLLILGAGTIGNLVAQSGKALGAKATMITDITDFKLNMAKECGIDYAVNTKNEDLKEAIYNAFGDDGVDVIYECTANSGALNQVLQIAGKGIPMVIIGVFAGVPNINLANVQDREYDLLGSLMYTEEDYVTSIELTSQNKIKLSVLISKKFNIEDMDKAYLYIEENKDEVQKVIVEV